MSEQPKCPQQETELELVEQPAPKTNDEKLEELIKRCNLVLEKINKRKTLQE